MADRKRSQQHHTTNPQPWDKIDLQNGYRGITITSVHQDIVANNDEYAAKRTYQYIGKKKSAY